MISPGILSRRMAGRNWLPGEAAAPGGGSKSNRKIRGLEGSEVTPDLHKMSPVNVGLRASLYGAVMAPQPSALTAWAVSQGRTGISCSARGRWDLKSKFCK